MSLINTILRSFFDLILAPFSSLPAWIPLTLLGAVVAFFALLVYKRFSNQRAIEATKARISAGFYEIRLFNDDLGKILKALGGLLRNNAIYIALSFVPLLVMLIPMWFVFAQLQFQYGYYGLKPDQSTTVTVTFKENALAGTEPPPTTLSAPSDVRVETPAVWIPAKRQLAWRVVPTAPGEHQLQWSLPDSGQTVSKSLTVTENFQRISPGRYEPTLTNLLLFPAEAPIPNASPVQSITVNHVARGVGFLGFELPWWLILFVMSIIVAFIIRDRMGVTF